MREDFLPSHAFNFLPCNSHVSLHSHHFLGGDSCCNNISFYWNIFLWSSSNDFSNFEVCTTEAFPVFPHVLLSCPIKNLFLRETVFDETFSLLLIGFGGDVKYIGQCKNMRTSWSFKSNFTSNYRHLIFQVCHLILRVFLKLERKKAEIGKYLIIQKYKMVYVHK